MKTFLTLLVLLMTVEGFTKVEDWDRFNSSLLIEVTRPNGVFTCTGVAVSKDLVITAAHCLDGIIKKVRIFTQEKYDPKQSSLEIASYKLHPQYAPDKSNYRNDIAKITMKDKIPAFVNIYPIFEGKKLEGSLYRFGFGARNKQNIRTVITPTFKQLDVMDDVIELNDKYSRSGDSGGPIFVEQNGEVKVLAIHSTLSTGPKGAYSFNLLLSAYLPWIYQN